jgi:hypothetical protein
VADTTLIGSSEDAVTFMVSAGLVFEIIAAACSSPQTTELNAGARSKTLWKWVLIGLALAAEFVLIAAFWLRGGWPAILGGALAGAQMGALYAYAKNCGLRDAGPATETY